MRVKDEASHKSAGTKPLLTLGTDGPFQAIGNKALDGEASLSRGKSRMAGRLLLLVLIIVFILSLGMIHTARFGEAYDDAIYVTAAKSLATNAGYRLISLPEPVAQTLVPPLYPFALSLIWRLSPFPDNLKWMMIFSAALMVGFLALTARYLVTHNYATHWQAVIIVILAGVNWRTMTLGTSIISEVLFALLSVATLYFAEKYERDQQPWIGGVVGLFAGLAFLTRTSAVVLFITVTAYLVLRRRWKGALLALGVGSLFVFAWAGWVYANRNTGGGEHAAYYAGYMRGIDATLERLQALNQVSRLNAQLKIVETNAQGLILVWMPFQSLGLRASIPGIALASLLMSFLAMFAVGLLRELRTRVRLLHIFLLFYVAVHLIAPSHSYERYLMPIVPFILLFVVRECSVLCSTIGTALISKDKYFKKAVPAFIALVFTAIATVALLSNATGILHSLTSSKHAPIGAHDVSIFDWIKANTNPSDVLICFSDQKYYLYTGRKSVRSIPVRILDLVVYQDREPDGDEMITVFSNIVDENRGSYVVFGARDFETQAPAYGKAIRSYLEQHPEQFIPEFRSIDGDTVIYRIQRIQVAAR